MKKPHRVIGADWLVDLTLAGNLARIEAVDQFTGEIGIPIKMIE